MLAIIVMVIPIFGLIFAGYIFSHLNFFGPSFASEFNKFVVYLALPALLFDVMANATWNDLYLPGFIATFTLSCAIIYALGISIRLYSAQHLADASIDGLSAAYANTGYIGFPLCLLVFGKESLPAVTIAAIITTSVLFAAAIIIIELSLEPERNVRGLLIKVGGALVKNPLLIAPILGGLFSASGMHMPSGGETFLKILGGAASPCALVAVGAFLAQKRGSEHADPYGPLVLTTVKLLLQPALTWFLAYYVFALPHRLADIAILLAALPTGTGPFMLAELYKRGTLTTSNTVLQSTVFGMVTLSLFLFFSGFGRS